MNKEWPDFKREMDKISVPTEKLDQIIDYALNEKKEGRKSPKRIALYSLSAAVIGLSLFIGSASVSPTMAKIASTIPVIGSFFNDSLDEGLKIAGQKGLTQVIDQSAKDRGITLTINEFFYDGTRLTLGYTQESLVPMGGIERPTILIDGEEINFASFYSGDFITPQKYKGMIDITPTEELPEEFEMSMRFDSVGFLPGKWTFDFPVKVSNEVTVIHPKEKKDIEGGEVEILTLKLGPAGTDLTVKIVIDPNNKQFDPHSLNFFIVDETGDVLSSLTGSGSGEIVDGMEEVVLQRLFTPVKEGAKKLRVIPYDIPLTTEGWEEVIVPLDGQTLPLEVEQGEFGKITVTDIDYQRDKTTLYYHVDTDVLLDKTLSRYAPDLVDRNGKSLILKDNPFPKRIEGTTYKQEFATGKQKGLQIKTYKFPKPILYPEFEAVIP